MKATSLQSIVMRRVYYSYAISIFSHAMFWQGVFLSVASALLAKWLHVASIFNNFLSVPVGRVPMYIYNTFVGAITHGEFITAITLVLASGVAVSVGYKLMNNFAPRTLVVSRA
jgi:hypothetical protein